MKFFWYVAPDILDRCSIVLVAFSYLWLCFLQAPAGFSMRDSGSPRSSIKEDASVSSLLTLALVSFLLSVVTKRSRFSQLEIILN